MSSSICPGPVPGLAGSPLLFSGNLPAKPIPARLLPASVCVPVSCCRVGRPRAEGEAISTPAPKHHPQPRAGARGRGAPPSSVPSQALRGGRRLAGFSSGGQGECHPLLPPHRCAHLSLLAGWQPSGVPEQGWTVGAGHLLQELGRGGCVLSLTERLSNSRLSLAPPFVWETPQRRGFSAQKCLRFAVSRASSLEDTETSPREGLTTACANSPCPFRRARERRSERKHVPRLLPGPW